MEGTYELFPLSDRRALIAKDGAPVCADVMARESVSERGRLKVTFTVPGPEVDQLIQLTPEFRLESN